jgi:hypothetical protein
LVLRDISGKAVTDIANSCPFNSSNEAILGRTDNEEMIFFSTRNDWNIYYTMTPRHEGINGNPQRGGGALCAPLQIVDLYFTNNGLRIEDDPDYFNYTNEDINSLSLRSMTSTEAYKDKFSGYAYFTPASDKRVMKQFYNR